MLNVKVLKEYAYNVLEVALKADAFQWYVAGVPLYSVKAQNDFGKEEECIFAKMEAIYLYYRNNPDSKINIQLEEILTNFTLNVKGDYGLINVLKCFSNSFSSSPNLIARSLIVYGIISSPKVFNK